MSIRTFRKVFWIVYALVSVPVVLLWLVMLFWMEHFDRFLDLELPQMIGDIATHSMSSGSATIMLAPGWMLLVYSVVEWVRAISMRKWEPIILVLTGLVSFVILDYSLPIFREYRDALIPETEELPFDVRIQVSMKYDGQPLLIDKVVQCQSFIVEKPSTPSRTQRPKTAYVAVPGVIGERLESGGGVFIWTPYWCSREEFETEVSDSGFIDVTSFNPDYVPIIGWMPTPDQDELAALDLAPDQVDFFELYVSPEYFNNPKARVQQVKIRIASCQHEKQRCDRPGFEEFAFLTLELMAGEKDPGTFGSFNSVGFTIIEPNEWRGISEELENYLSEFNEPAFINRTRLPSGKRASLVARDVVQEYSPRSLRNESRVENQLQEGTKSEETDVSPMDKFEPITPDQTSLRIEARGLTGWRIYRSPRSLEPPFKQRNGGDPTYSYGSHILEPSKTQERLKGTRFESNLYHMGSVIYDPETDRLIQISHNQYFRWRLRPKALSRSN